MLNWKRKIEQVAKSILFSYGITIFYLTIIAILLNQISNWFFSDWELVAEKEECGGFEKYVGSKKTLEECAYSCQRLTYFFIYGTNDFGESRCKSSGCKCYCELQSNRWECDYRVGHIGYRLYRFKSDSTGENTTLRDKILFLSCWIITSRTYQPFD